MIAKCHETSIRRFEVVAGGLLLSTFAIMREEAEKSDTIRRYVCIYDFIRVEWIKIFSSSLRFWRKL